MNWVTSCGVVIPCLNEEATLASLLDGIHKHLPAIMVVDDGSTDLTAKAARDHGATVLSTARSLGKGAALQCGLTALSQRQFAFAILMDGDGQHRPEDIPFFLQRAETTKAHLVVGNRMHNAKAIPWSRRFVNRWMSRRISRLAGQDFPDTQCGFRLVHLGTWQSRHLRTRHFEIESEMLLAFAMGGYRIEFVPIQVVGRSAHSHINVLTDTWRWLRWWQQSRKLRKSNRSP